MFSIQEYRFAESLDEALALLDASKRNRVIGGGMWLRLGRLSIKTAIDLSRLDLGGVRETEDESARASATICCSCPGRQRGM